MGVWKILWIIILIGAVGKLSFQVNSTIRQFLNQPSVTMVQTVTEEELTYPPLKLCIAHWIHWLDWNRTLYLNFTKEAVLFGMSYLTNVYSSQKFNITKAKEDFTSAMMSNNISTMEELYKIVSKPYIINSEFQYQLDEVEFDKTDDHNYLCYKSEGTKILFHFQNRKPQFDKKYTILLEQPTDWYKVINYTGKHEYDSYMAEWISTKTKEYHLRERAFNFETADVNYGDVENDYTEVIPPDRLYVDGYGLAYVNIMPEIDVYFITLKASAQRLKSKLNAHCLTGVKSFTSETICSTNCEPWAYQECGHSSKFLFEDALKLNQPTKPERLRKNKIIFLKENTGQKKRTINDGDNNTDKYTDFSKTKIPENSDIECKNLDQVWQKCISDRCALDGCDKWTYDVSVFTRSLHNSLHDVAYKKQTSIYIQYPRHTNVLIMIEVDSKSWEEFIGNVGGLLGIWTGASAISFFQLIYLCCFSSKESCPTKFGNNTKFNNIELNCSDD